MIKDTFTLLYKGDVMLLGGSNGLIYRAPTKFYGLMKDSLRLPIALQTQKEKPALKFADGVFNLIPNESIPENFLCIFSRVLDTVSGVELCVSFEEGSNTWLMKEYVDYKGNGLNIYSRVLSEEEIATYPYRGAKTESIELNQEEAGLWV